MSPGKQSTAGLISFAALVRAGMTSFVCLLDNGLSPVSPDSVHESRDSDLFTSDFSFLKKII